MGLFKRLFGICSTPPPAVADCWSVADGKVSVDLGRATELEMPGGAIRLEGKVLDRRILVFRGEDGLYYGFENRCSHAGHRRLDLVAGQGIIRCCSIGRSEFDYEGNRLAGAAQEGIEPLAVEINGQTLVIILDQTTT